MPIFDYQAVDVKGKKVRGSIDADSEKSARTKLKDKKIYPTAISISGKQQKFNPNDVLKWLQAKGSLSSKDLTLLTRQLATLVNAGLPLVDSLASTAEQLDKESLRRVLVNIREQVEQGTSLSDALLQYPKAFPKLYISMVAAGEASGNLDSVLNNLADHLEGQAALISKVKSAMMYPIFMLIICFLVIMGLFTFLVPKITVIFTKQGATLPLPTKITMVISNFLLGYWWLVILLFVAAGFAFAWFYGTEEGRSKVDRILLKLPIFAPIYQKVFTARISQTLAALLSGGVQLLPALDICKRTVGNVHVVDSLDKAREGVREGKSLAVELKRSALYPTMLTQMLAIGEKSGELESMLMRAGTAYKAEVDATLTGLTRLLELILIVIVGIIVLFVVFSVLMPMLDLISLVGG